MIHFILWQLLGFVSGYFTGCVFAAMYMEAKRLMEIKRREANGDRTTV